jgi:GntR family transcriptional repressor for pyruvate dehydrogenase complex
VAQAAEPTVTALDASAFPDVELPRAADAVMRALVDGLRAVTPPPGSRLPRDHELAGRFGVSRPVVREAIELLRRAGIVEVRRGSRGGVFVGSLAIPTELLTGRTDLAQEELRQLLEARRTIETTCALLAAERALDPELDELASLAERLETARADPPEFIELDARFHLRMAALSRNGPLQRALAAVFRDLAAVRARYPVAYGDMDTAIAYQRATVDALRTRDAERVLDAMDRHLAGLETHFLGRGIVLRRPVVSRRRPRPPARAA